MLEHERLGDERELPLLVAHSKGRGNAVIDMIVIVPGIMGSRLIDTKTRKSVWGVGRIGALKAAGNILDKWAAGRLADLVVTDEERDGAAKRLAPDGLIKEPVWGPTFRMNFGYRQLADELGELVLHPDALLEFAYDWRLSVEHNGRLLAEAIDRRLATWRRHRALAEWRRSRRDTTEPRVVIVAHSMGGLVARAAGTHAGALDSVRTVITIGTPFRGSVDAATMLNSGRSSVGLPVEHARELAITLPGLHDLLPTYRCLFTGDDLVALDPETVAALGGDSELARESFARHAQLASVRLPGLISLAGTHQPTDICFRVDAGVLHAQRHGYERDEAGGLARDAVTGGFIPMKLHGDGTVQWQSARLADATGYVQKHGALQATRSVIRNIQAQIEGRTLGEGLGGRAGIGVELPEYAPAGTVTTARVSGARAAGDFSCVVKDLDGAVLEYPFARRDGDDYVLDITLDKPGIHVLEVSNGVEPVQDAVVAFGLDDHAAS
ncbi:esterase/lipase family protein [Streptomyces sp. NPDC102283]|uniref:esterase/lipase family protein n=1 Tax=Streptomyces sp. NPDC102283 TaxID=3366155 RepID=UPI00381F7482